MTGLMDMMKGVQAAKAAMEEMQKQLASVQVEGRAGAGLVVVTMNGAGVAEKISIDDSLLKIEDKEILEDLLVAAMRDAKSNAEKAASEAMKKVTAGLPLPMNLFS